MESDSDNYISSSDIQGVKFELKKIIKYYGLHKALETLEKAIEEVSISDEEAFKQIDLSIMKEKKKQIDEASKYTKKRIKDIALHYGFPIINSRCKCPFHQGKNNTSLIFNDKLNTFYCFSCGIKGDIFTFIEKAEELKNEKR